jgi:hypothetical protein
VKFDNRSHTNAIYSLFSLFVYRAIEIVKSDAALLLRRQILEAQFEFSKGGNPENILKSLTESDLVHYLHDHSRINKQKRLDLLVFRETVLNKPKTVSKVFLKLNDFFENSFKRSKIFLTISRQIKSKFYEILRSQA